MLMLCYCSGSTTACFHYFMRENSGFMLCLHFAVSVICWYLTVSGVPRNFVRSGSGDSTNLVVDRGQRERGSVGGSHPVRDSGGSCNLVQEISFHTVIFFLIFNTLRLFMMTTNLFAIANVKQLLTGGSFRILLPFFRTSWGVGVLNLAIFNSFHNRVEFDTILEGLRNFGGGGGKPSNHPPRYATVYG